MNYKFIILSIFIFLYSCTNQPIDKKFKKQINKNYFINKGFTLVYSDNLYKEKVIKNKIEKRSLIIFQKNLKKNTSVKITNLNNSKYLIAKVGKKTEYPNFYNSVISKRISKDLQINENDPYIEIKEIDDNNSFVIKKAKIYDEEKQVASKAPVDDIQIKDLSNNKIEKNESDNKKFNYIIKIADFYFNDSAKDMKKRIINETNIERTNIIKLSNTQFRVFIGPFNDLNSLKKSFNAISLLGFDNLEIIKE